MSNLIRPSVFLRRVLLTDAILSAVTGAALVLDASALQGLLGLPESTLWFAGVASLPFAAYLFWLATRPVVPRLAAWVPIVLNIVWAAEVGWFGLSGGVHPTLLGEAFLVVQAAGALLLAELEFIGVRRACAIVAA